MRCFRGIGGLLDNSSKAKNPDFVPGHLSNAFHSRIEFGILSIASTADSE
jgi:hypothetical protein